MTETTSTRNDRAPQASFFKQYLRYSVDKNKMYLLASTISALLAVPLFVTIMALGFAYIIPEKYNASIGMILYFSIIFVGASFVGLYIMALTGGVRCFEVLTRRSKTDTLMCLPLNHSQRFWGDFLTGYITSVAPIIPAGIVGIIIGAIAQGSRPTEHYVKFAFLYAMTTFFFMTFAYSLSVLAAALCGNISGGIVTSAILAVVSIGVTECWGRFFIQCIVGFTGNQYPENKLIEPIPSSTIFAELFKLFSAIDLSVTNSINDLLNNSFAILNPLNVIFYILLPAGITALAYCIAKRRKCEHTGEIFAAKHSAAAVTIMLIVTATGGVCCLFTSNFNWIFASIACVITSAVICLAVELILRLGVNKLGKRVIVYAVSTVAAVGFSVLIEVTHALGMSFYIPSADKIKSVEFIQGGYQSDITQYNAYYTFDQKPDIEKLRENHAALLNENIGVLTTNRYQYNGDPNITTFKYTLENGETFMRTYLVSYRSTEENILGSLKAKKALQAMPNSLESFPTQYAAPLLSENIRGSEVSLGGSLGNYYIFPEDLSELSRILHDDIINHYSPDILPIGSVTVFTEEKDRSFDILETYENTLAFIKSNAIFIDDTAFSFKFSLNEYTISIDITKEDIASPTGKELMALMRSCHPSDIETISSEEYQTGIHVSSPDYFYWYIPTSNMPQVTALITQIASERV